MAAKVRVALGSRLAGLVLVASIVVGTLGISSPPAGAQDATILGGLPQETTLLVRVPSLQTLIEKAKKSPLAKLSDHPEVKEALGDLERELQGGMTEARERLGFDPMDLAACFEGETVLLLGGLDALAAKLGGALSTGAAPEMGPEDLPFAIASDAGSSADRAKGYLEKFFEFAVTEGAIRETVDVSGGAGGKLTILSDSEESDAGSPDPDPDPDADGAGGGDSTESPLRLYFGQAQNRFFFGTSRGFLERVMAGKAAPGATLLVDSPTFLESRRAAGDGDVFAYLNVKQLTRAINGALSATFFAFYWQKAEALLFGNSLNAMAASYSLEDRGVRNGFFVHNGGASDGIMGLLRGQPFSSTPPAFIPKEAKAYASMNLNVEHVSKIVKEIAQIAMAFQPGAGDIDTLFEQSMGVKFGEFFGSFGDKIHYYGETFDAQNALGSLNYVLELKAAAPLEKVLARFSAPGAGMLTQDSVDGATVYSLPAGPMGELAMAIKADRLVVAGGKGKVTAVLDRLSKGGAGLADQPEAKALLSSLAPPQVSMLSYSSKDYFAVYMDSIAQTVSTLASEPEAQTVVSLLKLLGELLGESAGYAQWTDKGLRGEGILLYR